jgi:hypothetical protein
MSIQRSNNMTPGRLKSHDELILFFPTLDRSFAASRRRGGSESG